MSAELGAFAGAALVLLPATQVCVVENQGVRHPPVQATLLTAGGGNWALPSFVLRRDSWPGEQATTTGIPSATALRRLAGRFARC